MPSVFRRAHAALLAASLLQAGHSAQAAAPVPASGLARPVQTAGPVPDYAPVGRVVVNARTNTMAPAVVRALRNILGPDLEIDGYDPCGAQAGVHCDRWPKSGRVMWVRDYSPFAVLRDDGHHQLVTYLSPDPNRAGYAAHVLGQTTSSVHEFAQGAPAPRAMPLLHENGNLVASDRYVFVSEFLLEFNREPPVAVDLPPGTFQRRTSEDTLAVFATSIGRRPQDVVVLPALPADSSRHVDMYLMALDPETLLVPQIKAEAIRASVAGPERNTAFQAAAFLDAVASRLQAGGLIVERLPMLGPLRIPVYDEPNRMQIVYDSPTNALLLSRERERHVLLPVVHVSGRSPVVEQLRRTYENTWADFFRRRGFTPHLVDVGGLAERGVLIRCATAVLPPVPGARTEGRTLLHAQNGTLVR